jgi:EAL domain-containing protein (putative c-di-GMP-specific phosphodiesterase class I)
VVPVSINVSPRQFNTGSVPALLRRSLEETGIPASLLQVEITESAMMGDDEQVAMQLTALDEMGIKTHVDDFGTGYSSLALLQRLSLDILKIDRAFAAELGVRAETEILYRAMISMAHALGMSVVAEGVETTAQLNVLRRLECDEIQGFLFSMPVPAADAALLLAERGTVLGYATA